MTYRQISSFDFTLIDNSAIDAANPKGNILLHDITLFEHIKSGRKYGETFLDKLERLHSHNHSRFSISMHEAAIIRLELSRGKPAHEIIDKKMTESMRWHLQNLQLSKINLKEETNEEVEKIKSHNEYGIRIAKDRHRDLSGLLDPLLKKRGMSRSSVSSKEILLAVEPIIDESFNRACHDLTDHSRKANNLYKKRTRSFLYRSYVADWALVAQIYKGEESGLESSNQKLQNMMTDNRYLALASMCNEFITNDSRQQRRHELVAGFIAARTVI